MSNSEGLCGTKTEQKSGKGEKLKGLSAYKCMKEMMNSGKLYPNQSLP